MKSANDLISLSNDFTYVMMIFSYYLISTILFTPGHLYLLSSEVYNLHTTDFCRHRCGFKFNICCIYKDKNAIGKPCKNRLEMIQFTDEDRHTLLNNYNSVRNVTAGGESPRINLRNIYASNMQILSYSKQLEYTAACWAKQCTLNHSRCKANEVGELGETICWTQSSAATTQKSFRKLLYKCPMYYLYSYPDIATSVIDSVTFPSVGDDERNRETTQLLWSDTQYIGCSAVIFPHVVDGIRIVFIVCHFAPAGNSIGRSVFQRGKPCSLCSFNGRCSMMYKNLCGYSRPFQDDKWIPPIGLVARRLSITTIDYFVLVWICLGINYNF